MKAKEIIEFLNGLDLSIDEIGHACNYDNKLVTTKCGPIEYKAEGERQLFDADSIESIIYFKDHDVYIGMFGFHDSWNGSSFEDGHLLEVKPKTVEVTVYEEV